MGDFLSVVSLVAFVAMLVMGIRLLRVSVTATRRAWRWLAASGVTWIGAFGLSVLAAPGAPHQPPPPGADGSAQMSVAGYTQTWPKGYTATTCEEFADVMSPSQQLAAAADMLTLVWMKIEDTAASPSDSLIQEYRAEVAERCDVPTESIAQVAWAIWINDERFAA